MQKIDRMRVVERCKGIERVCSERRYDGKSGLRGSFTVEAAVVVSLTVLVLGALLLAVFFRHDRAVFQAMVCESAAVGSNFFDQEDGARAAKAVSGGISQERFLGSRNVAANSSVGTKTSSASGSSSYPVPGICMNYFSNGTLKIQCSWTSKVLDPAEVIRKIRGAELVYKVFQE